MGLGTPSSIRCGTPTGPNRRPMAGKRCLLFSLATWRLERQVSPLNKDQDTGKEIAPMCSYIVEKTALVGSAKGRKGWMRIDTANVYFDHPYYSTLDLSWPLTSPTKARAVATVWPLN